MLLVVSVVVVCFESQDWVIKPCCFHNMIGMEAFYFDFELGILALKFELKCFHPQKIMKCKYNLEYKSDFNLFPKYEMILDYYRRNFVLLL